MGYNVYITRAETWDDNDGREIEPSEWTDVISTDPDLLPHATLGPLAALWSASEDEEGWLLWDDGNIYSKNPNGALVGKMVQIASTLGAIVQGDDGERYPVGPQVPKRPHGRKRSLIDRVLTAFSSPTELVTSRGVFRKGGRVRECHGDRHLGTIISLDPAADSGLGVIEVRLDDGRVVKHSVAAPGIDPVD